MLFKNIWTRMITLAAAGIVSIGLATAGAEAKKTKELESPLIKAWLKDNGPLYDGESGLEARLQPHSAPRWLDPKVTDALLRWAFNQGLLNLAVGKMEKMPDSPAIDTFEQFVNPGGEGEPRLKVSKRDAE